MDSSFPQFQFLPPELRHKIWRLAIPHRIVPARLKLDLDAWNAATESDWVQIHYRIIPDGRAPPLPRLALVNHEARHEIIKSYKPLQISRDAVKRSLGTQSVDEVALGIMCSSSKITRFNVESDVLEWGEPRRWTTGTRELPYPIFLAACLSVRHVSLEYDLAMHTQLETLALAVLDQDQQLETLTIGVNVEFRSGKLDSRFRLARSPPGPSIFFLEKFEEWKDVDDILSQYPTCLLYRTSPDDPVQGLHPLVNETLTKGYSPAQKPLSPKTRLDTRFSVYEILQPGKPKDEGSSLSLDWAYQQGSKVFIPDRFGNKHFWYYEGIQVDILLWLQRLRDVKDGHNLMVPCHGFCVPDYGLP
ncbi:uncharacterized protein F4812DRAFT_100925 [Daldinia caldariorum]|uniref:uncharacterized protein n=1 Tax=Daldinia caldariorum TaxID=326644 RepID=UPI002007A568|nr:uncharacterized protein F4812DRAFT_100925 [Daldinia caldariorum]KAI1466245.1 hypothetical protein F4812DRAFT_100925 [Daldinia caldariorum]